MSHILDQYGNKIKSNRIKEDLGTKVIPNTYNPSSYDEDPVFKSYDGRDPKSVHSTYELIDYVSQHREAEVDARIIGVRDKEWRNKSLNRKEFLNCFQQNSPWDSIQFKETDFFARGSDLSFSVGNDFVPLLGGPFFKNQYFYQDYIQMHAEAFYAYNHDPIARAITQITRDFVIGGGFQVQCDESEPEGKLAIAAWRMFEEANDLQNQIDQYVTEQSIYGENLWWCLPNNQTKIIYHLGPGDTIPLGIIPRIRLLDPSTCVEIVTYPEDITRPLFYVFLFPTQYQIYTSGIGNPQTSSYPTQPTLKFIYQQVAADQIMHSRINSVSNEKRGRSDYFPVFSYLKRLRDSVNYSLIGLQKASAWAIDTEIDGDQADIDNYVRNMATLGTIPTAGSEFAHSTKIKRNILANSGGGQVSSSAFEWSLSMICSGVGIPVSYLGTHLSGGTTKASALVATEPVAKKMQKRQETTKRELRKIWNWLMKEAGLPRVDVDIILPEILVQDKSQKLKDLLLMQNSRWISPKRAADMAAKELSIYNFNYDQEIENMQEELPEVPMPLLNPGKISPTGQPGQPLNGQEMNPISQGGSLSSNPQVTGVTSNDRKTADAERL